MKQAALFLLFLSTLLFAEKEKPLAFELIHPLEKAVLHEGFVTVTLDIKEQHYDKIEIVADDINQTFSRQTIPGKKVYCKTVPLKPGENTLRIAVYRESQKIAEMVRELFYTVEVFEGCEEAPYGYRRQEFHLEDSERRCSACHSFKPPRSKIKVSEDEPEPDGITIEIEGDTYLIPGDLKEISCYQCHKGLLSRNNAHAPAINGLCTECHKGEKGEYDFDESTSNFLAPDPIEERCFSCHKAAEESKAHYKVEHGPTQMGQCNMCHNPHSSDNEFFLRKPIWELCTTCHARNASGRHVVMGFSSQSFHPTRGKPDPSRPGRELVCSGCHNPHGSQKRKLLRSPKSGKGMFCARCHQK